MWEQKSASKTNSLKRSSSSSNTSRRKRPQNPTESIRMGPQNWRACIQLVRARLPGSQCKVLQPRPRLGQALPFEEAVGGVSSHHRGTGRGTRHLAEGGACLSMHPGGKGHPSKGILSLGMPLVMTWKLTTGWRGMTEIKGQGHGVGQGFKRSLHIPVSGCFCWSSNKVYNIQQIYIPSSLLWRTFCYFIADNVPGGDVHKTVHPIKMPALSQQPQGITEDALETARKHDQEVGSSQNDLICVKGHLSK